MSIDTLSNHEVIPEIDSSLFEGHEAAQFAVGVVAVGNEIIPGLEDEYDGYTLLRGNVYALQKKYMSKEELNADGTETDEDDDRSVHFVALENTIDGTRVVGGMRLIVKTKAGETFPLSTSMNDSSIDKPLPIEKHYPEAFVNGAAPFPSNEASRLMARHEAVRIQKGIKWALFAAGVSYITQNNLGPAFGAVEPLLSRGLQMEGMPVTELEEAKFVEEFNAKKLPIRIDVPQLAQKIEKEQPGVMKEAKEHNFVYSGIAKAASLPIPA